HRYKPRLPAHAGTSAGASPSGKAPVFGTGIRRFESCRPSQPSLASRAGRGGTRMNDDEAIGAVIDEMYAMISGPAGPRDWSRQDNCFLPEARQVRTWVDEQGR